MIEASVGAGAPGNRSSLSRGTSAPWMPQVWMSNDRSTEKCGASEGSGKTLHKVPRCRDVVATSLSKVPAPEPNSEHLAGVSLSSSSWNSLVLMVEAGWLLEGDATSCGSALHTRETTGVGAIPSEAAIRFTVAAISSVRVALSLTVEVTDARSCWSSWIGSFAPLHPRGVKKFVGNFSGIFGERSEDRRL